MRLSSQILLTACRVILHDTMATTHSSDTKFSITVMLRQVQEDVVALTKARLSALVVVTTIFGYLFTTKLTGEFSWLVIFHLVIGTSLSAGGAAIFNQLMEVDADAKMYRTANRPLPSKRLPKGVAFVIGWFLAAFGLVHLGVRVNPTASAVAAATLVSYLFFYTPMKQISSVNTLLGAIAGALPPLIGVAGGGVSLTHPSSIFLFGLLFFWQLPHFAAINWIHRDDYVRGGFQMWANTDTNAVHTGRIAVGYSVVVFAFTVGFPFFASLMSPWAALPSALLGGWLIVMSVRFLQGGTRRDARRLFFYTLLYLPLELLVGWLAWGGGVAV